MALVESAIRHCRYLERAVEVGGLANVTVVNARAEAWPEGIGVHDLVTARALGALPVILEYAAPLLADGGHVVAWKGAVAEPRRPRGPSPRRRSSASSRSRSSPSRRSRARATTRCTRSARSRPRRSASRAGPGWRRSARSAPDAGALGSRALRRPKVPLNAGSMFHVKRRIAAGPTGRRR